MRSLITFISLLLFTQVTMASELLKISCNALASSSKTYEVLIDDFTTGWALVSLKINGTEMKDTRTQYRFQNNDNGEIIHDFILLEDIDASTKSLIKGELDFKKDELNNFIYSFVLKTVKIDRATGEWRDQVVTDYICKEPSFVQRVQSN